MPRNVPVFFLVADFRSDIARSRHPLRRKQAPADAPLLSPAPSGASVSESVSSSEPVSLESDSRARIRHALPPTGFCWAPGRHVLLSFPSSPSPFWRRTALPSGQGRKALVPLAVTFQWRVLLEKDGSRPGPWLAKAQSVVGPPPFHGSGVWSERGRPHPPEGGCSCPGACSLRGQDAAHARSASTPASPPPDTSLPLLPGVRLREVQLGAGDASTAVLPAPACESAVEQASQRLAASKR